MESLQVYKTKTDSKLNPDSEESEPHPDVGGWSQMGTFVRRFLKFSMYRGGGGGGWPAGVVYLEANLKN